MGFGKDGKGVIMRETRSQTIGTLAAQSGLIIGTNIPTLERFRMLKTEVLAAITGLTAGEEQGLYIGLADGDLDLAEIEAAIELDGPLGPNDSVTESIAERWQQWLGSAHADALETECIFLNAEGGYMLNATPRWTFARTKSWNWFLYNLGAAFTTGATVHIRCKNFGVWVT